MNGCATPPCSARTGEGTPAPAVATGVELFVEREKIALHPYEL
ncbi:hypothetical protein [Streptomyces sp. DT117]